MKGMGTNEKKIINVTNSYSHKQRMVIKDMFTKVYKRNLMKDLKSELSGKFEVRHLFEFNNSHIYGFTCWHFVVLVLENGVRILGMSFH